MMTDIYLKKVVIHQFLPGNLDLQFAQGELKLTPKVEEYLRQKVSRTFSEEAKTGVVEESHFFLKELSADFLKGSCAIAQQWLESFRISENQKNNDLVFLAFDYEGQSYFAFLRIALRESLAHVAYNDEDPIQMIQNNLPSPSAIPDDAFIVKVNDNHYWLIEKRIKYNGSFLHYFSDNLLQVNPNQSAKKTIKTVEKTAQKIAEDFNQDDFQFQTKVKKALFQNIEEEKALSPEKLADQLFEDNLTARLTFVNQMKESVPEKVVFDAIDSSRQMKKLANQRLSLSNGIEMIVPSSLYNDAETVEFIQNEDGSYSILIKNIKDIQSK